jgi:(S)-3,5-dihydroxyphenylglycine transaminase
MDAFAHGIEQIRDQGKNPRALYVIPDFNNPLGTSMSLDERWRLLDLARKNEILIVEDNAYGMFAYDTEPAPTLKSLDREGVVIYLGTFSKILFPGLRIGFLVADQEVEAAEPTTTCSLAQELSKVKSLTSVTTSPLLQAIVGGILLNANCSLRAMMQAKVEFYRANRDMMLACLEQHFNSDPVLAGAVSWNYPGGGFFLTVTLPFTFTEDMVRMCAEQYGVICCPMSFFSLLEGHENQIRLSFSYVSKDQIERGIFQLWKFVHDRVSTKTGHFLNEAEQRPGVLLRRGGPSGGDGDST